MRRINKKINNTTTLSTCSNKLALTIHKWSKHSTCHRNKCKTSSPFSHVAASPTPPNWKVKLAPNPWCCKTQSNKFPKTISTPLPQMCIKPLIYIQTWFRNNLNTPRKRWETQFSLCDSRFEESARMWRIRNHWATHFQITTYHTNTKQPHKWWWAW